MASQSFVLVQLFCLVMLARHSACWGNYECYHSLRYHDSNDTDSQFFKKWKFPYFVNYLFDEWGRLKPNDWETMGITEANAQKVKWPIKCAEDVSCETYRCKNANGNDIFVVNGCAKEKVGGEKCTLHSHLIDYCNPRDYPHSFASCSQCYGKNCNLKDINLIRPADHSPRENHCIHAFRHNQSYEPDPALKEMVKEWNIKDYSDKFNLECGLGNVGCQTYRCKNEFGNDKFVVNGCATNKRLKCVYKELDPFCVPQKNMYDHCEYCLGPSCNLNKTELETLYTFKSRATKATTRSTKATTTTDALDNETDEPESTKGPKKAHCPLYKAYPAAAGVEAAEHAHTRNIYRCCCCSTSIRRTIPQRNRWDSAACAKNLSLSEPERLIAQFTEVEDWGDRAVLAEQPIISKGNSGIFYFEMQILAQKLIDVNTVYIGLSTKETPLDRRFVLYNGTYAYGSNGLFWGNPGAGPFNRDNGQAWVDGKPSFGIGDVVGCGVNLATRQIIYTKNGRPLDTANLFVDSVDKLFPCVSLDYPGDKIEANFGPNFVYQF
ncbi:hypothetical protein GPALN_010645 [Globodera pallida]|nr:hypothetical protein GPALN_010645 [Globodera pallida]